MISLGYNIYMSLMSFGDDPKCFVGWDNLVKWQFFIPLLAGVGVRHYHKLYQNPFYVFS